MFGSVDHHGVEGFGRHDGSEDEEGELHRHRLVEISFWLVKMKIALLLIAEYYCMCSHIRRNQHSLAT